MKIHLCKTPLSLSYGLFACRICVPAFEPFPRHFYIRSHRHPEPPVPGYFRYTITLPLLHCSQCHICPLPDMNLHQTARLVLPMHVDPEPLLHLLYLFYSLFHRYSDLFSGNNTSRSHFWYLSVNPLIPGSLPDLTLILNSLRQLRFSAASFPAALQVQNLSYNNPVRLPDYRNSRLLWNIHPP